MPEFVPSVSFNPFHCLPIRTASIRNPFLGHTAMAAPTPNSSWLDDAFKSAKDDFKRSLKNPALYDFSRISTIDDVLEEATKIEKQQAKTKTLRGLTRIRPFINGLKEYSAVVEVFVQAKPDVLSLIWVYTSLFLLLVFNWGLTKAQGPLKLILQVG